MKFEIYPIPAFKDNYIWAIIHAETKSVLIVDPGDATPVVNFIESRGLILTTILITHHHADHCGGVNVLREKYGSIIYAPQHKNIDDPDVIINTLTKIELPIFGEFEVINIPGHTVEHVAYYNKKQQILFCGDTLFSAGCGRVFEGTFEQMYHSLMLLKALPDNTKIYCAHEYTLANLLFAKAVEPNNNDVAQMILAVEKKHHENLPSLPSTLSLENKVNPFLRCEMPDVIIAAENHEKKLLKTPVEVFTTLRLWKNNF